MKTTDLEKDQGDSNSANTTDQQSQPEGEKGGVERSEAMEVSGACEDVGQSSSKPHLPPAAVMRDLAAAKILFNDLFCVDKAGDVARLSDGTLPSDAPIYNRSSSSIIGEEKGVVAVTTKVAGGEIYRPPKLW